MTKLNWYIFMQIIKSCTLIFFIFISIAWLTQISRLFTIMNSLQIEFYRIISLSTYIIPNLANITLPFILIFGLLLAFTGVGTDIIYMLDDFISSTFEVNDNFNAD